MAIKDTFLREVKIGDRVELMIGAKETEGLVVALDLDTVRIRKNKGKELVLLLDSISYYEKRQKKQVAEVDRMADVKRSLQLAKNTPYRSVKQGPALERVFIVDSENQKKQDYLLDQLVKKTDSMVYVHYNTDRIFDLVDSLVELLKKAKQTGTTETINRCIIALNYALTEGLAPVPKNKKDEDVKKQREDILSAYYQICNETLIQDTFRNAIEEKEKEKTKKEKELEDAKNDFALFAASHYAAFKKVKELTPDQRTKLTGIESQIAAKMRRATDRHVEIVHIEQRIGQINLNLTNVEHSCNNLFNIIKDLQVSVDKDNVEEINRLTREWEKTVREEQENIGKLRDAANEMNIAFDVIYNSRETKEAIISINDDYENMMHKYMQCAARKVEDVGCQRSCITESFEPSPGISADTVQFSIVSQRKIQTARYLEIGLFMYEDSYRHVIQKLIDESGDILQEKSSGYQQVKRYKDITAVLQSNDIAYYEEITLRWMGKYLKFNFVAEVPESYFKKEILFWADIFVEGIKLSHLALIVSVDAQKEVAQIERKDIRSAFISYSSKDREQVISIVYGMKKARPDMDIYLDVERLVSGQHWADVLEEEILSRDILYLCWSTNAKQSEWVDREWRCAYGAKGIAGVEPVPLEPPDLCPPPAELSEKHFNDILLLIIRTAKRKTNEIPEAVMDLKTGNSVSLKMHGSISIGRDDSNTMIIKNDPFISRNHCALCLDNSNHIILYSYGLNGTFIYTRTGCVRLYKNQSMAVTSGNVIGIGQSYLLLA